MAPRRRPRVVVDEVRPLLARVEAPLPARRQREVRRLRPSRPRARRRRAAVAVRARLQRAGGRLPADGHGPARDPEGALLEGRRRGRRARGRRRRRRVPDRRRVERVRGARRRRAHALLGEGRPRRRLQGAPALLARLRLCGRHARRLAAPATLRIDGVGAKRDRDKKNRTRRTRCLRRHASCAATESPTAMDCVSAAPLSFVSVMSPEKSVKRKRNEPSGLTSRRASSHMGTETSTPW